MALNLRGIPNLLFENAREEEIGIAEKEKEVSSAAVDLFTNQFTVTGAFTEVTGMSITHESKTGKVLVLFSAGVSPWSYDTGNGDTIQIFLQKDGVNVNGSRRDFSAFVDVGGADVLVVDMNAAISHVDTNAERNTWRIVAKRFGTGDNFINDRNLIIIDL